MVLLLYAFRVSSDFEYLGICIWKETAAYTYFMIPDTWLTI